MLVIVLNDRQECACGGSKIKQPELVIFTCPECNQIFCSECFEYTDNQQTVACPACSTELDLPSPADKNYNKNPLN